MDEPLANLDALLRLEMRVELKRLQQELQADAGLRDARPGRGHVDGRPNRRAQPGQCCSSATRPDAIYNLPANRFVATVIGSPPTNFIPAR